MTIKVTYNVTDVYMSQSVSPVYINVSYSDGGASGGGVWGSITGTLSNQTDLQTALDLKLDESTIDGGAEGQILSKASATDFDFAWINNYAKYLATNVRNQTGSTIGAFQVVYISGATGNKPLISLADADTEATSSKTYGVTATSIANNGTGDVVTAGELSGINTSAFNEGDLLWLSTTAGGVVTTPPAEPAHAVFIGYVVRSHPTLGVIDVSIQNGYELNELHGVQITTPTDNQGLFYNATSTLWENKSITTALGYTPVPTTRNITINGVTYDLSADRTWTISTGISGSGAAGQVTYWTGSSAVSGSNNLFWDNTNGRLGIGTNAPGTDLDISKSVGSGGVVLGRFTNTNSTGQSGVVVRNDALEFGAIEIYGSTFGNTSLRNRASFTSSGANGFSVNLYNNSSTANFSIFRTVSVTECLRLFNSTGNLLLQNGGTFTDGGQRLQVIGDTLLRGSGNTSGTTALTVQNSSSTNLLNILNNGNVGIGTNAPSTLLHVVGSVILNGASITIQNSSPSGDVTFGNNAYIRMGSTRFRATGVSFQFQDNSYNDRVVLNTSSGLSFFNSGGNYSFGTGSDLGVRLGVVGDTILRGSGATSATTALTVQNSSSTNLFTVRNDGLSTFYNNTSIQRNFNGFLNLEISNSTAGTDAYSAITVTAALGAVNFGKYSNLKTAYKIVASGDGYFYNSTQFGDMAFLNDFATGQIKFAAGGSSTAHLTIKSNGRINMSSLPTSATGLVAGDLWNDAGTVKIV